MHGAIDTRRISDIAALVSVASSHGLSCFMGGCVPDNYRDRYHPVFAFHCGRSVEPTSDEMDDLADEYYARKMLEKLEIPYPLRRARSHCICIEHFRSYVFWKSHNGRWLCQRMLMDDDTAVSADSLKGLLDQIFADPHVVAGENYIQPPVVAPPPS